jgi:hypothetical protein
MQAFRPFIAIILDKICGVPAVQAEVRKDLPLWAALDDNDDESPDDLMIGPIAVPFDLLQKFKTHGIDADSRKRYIQGCLQGSSDTLNRRFYWSDDGRPHLASHERKSAAPAAPIES